MKKIGAFVGKFYPPHIGHLWVVDNLVTKLDELYIVISKNDLRNQAILKNDGFAILPAELIEQWFKKHYKDNPKIKVAVFDESNFRPYPQDRDKWAEKFKKEFPEVNVKIADESYRKFNEEYFPEYEFLSIPRNIINVHSTQIRQNAKANLQNLIPEAREYFER